ncbi:restriction endonuclease subunit S [Algoriphagus resistens]|uniref:restriction endonuclease subunit S n=1 Tax=Algoriphagus resistens TaxID=1750590 RepID=UPI000716AF4D|nr:restriction endonuclease subunit S [Algoriphagus resistens]
MELTATKATFQKYPAYKDSGVEWLGEIPEGWELRRFKYLFKEINERSTDGTGDLLSVSQYTGVTKKSDKVDEGDLLTTASTLEGYKKVYRSDLVSNIMLAWNGSLGFSPFDGITSPAYSIYRLYKGNSERFFHYLVRSQIYKSEFKRNSSGVIESRLRLYTDDFFAIWSILPTPSEQTAIANFLDDKTAKIDRAIAQKEQLIALLKERKQIIIQNAVTGKVVWNEKEQKMIPLALSGVEGKDSGVEWIGEIPEHWEIVANRVLFKETKLPGREGLPLLSVSIHSAVSTEELSDEDNIRGLIKIEDKANYKFVAVNDIVFNMMRAWQGAIGAVKVEGMVSPAYVVAKPNKKIIASYFEYLYRTSSFIQQMSKNSKGITDFRKRLYWDEFKQLQTVLPPKLKQLEIVKYIETQSTKIDQAISLQQTQIQKLKEYKATLIDSAVTGKIKVD